VVAPWVLVAILLLGVLCQLFYERKASASELFYRSLPLVTRTLFFLYPIVTNIAFESFSCYSFDGGEFRWLISDVNIDCKLRGTSGSEYSKVFSLAWVAIAMYPVGLVVLFAVLLFRARDAIRDDDPTPLSVGIEFLHREFQPAYYWWELVEMVRRLLLIGLFVLIERGSVTQLIVGLVYCLAHLLVQLKAAPYNMLGDNFVADASNFAMTILFVCLIMFQVSVTAGLDEVQALLSPELRDDITVDPLALTAVLTITLFLAIAVGGVLLVYEIRKERARQELEARYAVARRLRFVSTGMEVQSPKIPHGAFHLFLSHVWGTGQDQMRVIKQRLKEMMPKVVVFLDVDDLQFGRGAEYVDLSTVILTFCSRGYFSSCNCMREILRGIHDKKPLVALLEPDVNHGHMSLADIKEGLAEADGKYGKWGLQREMDEWGMPKPTPQAIFDTLFAAPPLEWSRITAFQDVTLRAIAHRILGDDHAPTLVQDEVAFKHVELPALLRGQHVFCSPDNPGALELLEELAVALKLKISVRVDGGEASPDRKLSRLVGRRLKHSPRKVESAQSVGSMVTTGGVTAMKRENSTKGLMERASTKLHVSHGFISNFGSDASCMLVYLDSRTWTRGDDSLAFAQEVHKAMEMDLLLLLAHEMPGLGQEDQHPCEFGDFFGNTPPELLSAGIYNDIAMPLRGGMWRPVSMVMLGKAVRKASMAKSDEQYNASSSSFSRRWLRSFSSFSSHSSAKTLAEPATVQEPAGGGVSAKTTKKQGVEIDATAVQVTSEMPPTIAEVAPASTEVADEEAAVAPAPTYV